MFLHIFFTRRSKYWWVLVKCCTKETLYAHTLFKIRGNIAFDSFVNIVPFYVYHMVHSMTNIQAYIQLWWWWFSARKQVHWLLRHLGMRWVRWFPVAFLTDNYGLATCPKSLRYDFQLQGTEHTHKPPHHMHTYNRISQRCLLQPKATVDIHFCKTWSAHDATHCTTLVKPDSTCYELDYTQWHSLHQKPWRKRRSWQVFSQ